jgi:phage gpG-like protein
VDEQYAAEDDTQPRDELLMDNGLSSYIRKLDRVAKALDRLPAQLATEAVNFSKDRFREQNWVDNTTDPWKPRKRARGSARRSRGAILIDNGVLRKSIRIVLLTRDYAVIGTDVPYAQAHNDGVRATVNQSVKRHTRNGREVEEFTRTVRMKLPRRRFLGASAILTAKMKRLATIEIARAIRGN